jgi:predicted lipoprotein with Yx(FWY)xxD motif
MRRVTLLVHATVGAAVLGLSAACGGGSPPAAAPASSAPEIVAAPSGQGGSATQGGSGAQGGHSGSGGHGGAHGHHAGPGGVELYAVQTAVLGTVVTDGAGRLLYGSAGDANDPPTSRCADACAQQWHPLVVPAGQEPQLLGVDADKVGRVTRADGAAQVTLSGWPLYVNSADDGALKSTAPDARGAWFVLTPQGERVPV